MNERRIPVPSEAGKAELLQNLLEISVGLSATRDRRAMLETILAEARRLSRAEAGSLYVRRADHLEFVVAQNDAVDVSRLREGLLGRTVPIGSESLAGFVAKAGRTINIPDAYHLAPGAPFRIDRAFDAATGYHTHSLLVLPLTCPDGETVGVLQLINRRSGAGAVVPFPCHDEAVLESLAAMAAVSIQNALLVERLKHASLDTIIRLSVVAEYRDSATAEHIQRISRISSLVGGAMGLDHDQVELIQCASPMHDIGKIGIPDAILLKPGRLTEEERKIVETHTLIGAEILGESTNELMQMAHDIALHHHERWDGKGYPHRLKGDKIPLPARIVCLADVFDALATRRCYKDAYPMEKVAKILREERGCQFDARVLDAFWRILDQVRSHYHA